MRSSYFNSRLACSRYPIGRPVISEWSRYPIGSTTITNQEDISLQPQSIAMLRLNSLPVIMTSVLINPPRQRIYQPLPQTPPPPLRQHQPPTEHSPTPFALIYSSLASSFSTQETSSLRFQSAFLGATVPAKAIGFHTHHRPGLFMYF
jgi:hypothetical protein